MASASGTHAVPKGSGAVLGLWLSACTDRFTSQGNGTFLSPWPCPALDSRMDSDQIPKGMGQIAFLVAVLLGWVTCNHLFFSFALTVCAFVPLILDVGTRFLLRCRI